MKRRNIRRFTTVTEILDFYRSCYPHAEILKTRDEHDSLAVSVDHGDSRGVEFVHVRDCSTSQYYITEVPA